MIFKATTKPSFVDVTGAPYLMVDGAGDPNTGPAYAEAVQALYRAAYKVRAVLKAAGQVYSVPPLQGLWSGVGDGTGDRSGWKWTMLLRQPAEATPDLVPPGPVRLEWWHEGRCAQILHQGPFETETGSIVRLLEYIRSHGLEPTGRHHEIYLSDPRRTAPEKRRTILRYAVAPGAELAEG